MGQLRQPPVFRESIQCDGLHRARCEAHVDQRLRADLAGHQVFAVTDDRSPVKAVIKIAVPLGNVLLPTCLLYTSDAADE